MYIYKASSFEMGVNYNFLNQFDYILVTLICLLFFTHILSLSFVCILLAPQASTIHFT